MKDNNLKILFLGDVVGRIGRNAVTDYLAENKSKYDFYKLTFCRYCGILIAVNLEVGK